MITNRQKHGQPSSAATGATNAAAALLPLLCYCFATITTTPTATIDGQNLAPLH
jgi:hypothetical protein